MASAVKEVPGQETDEKSTGESVGDTGDPPADQGECRGGDGLYLVEEASLNSMPQHMRILLGRFPRDSLTPENLLLVLLYLLITECGFRPHTDSLQEVRESFDGFYSCSKTEKLASSVSIEWLEQAGDFQERHFRLLDFHEDFTLITHRIADTLCATFTGQSQGFSIVLSISRYIPIIRRQSVQRSFRNLQELSHRTKNRLILPVRDIFMQNRITIAPYPSLFAMPHVVLTKIFRLLPRNAQRNLSKTCERLNSFQM